MATVAQNGRQMFRLENGDEIYVSNWDQGPAYTNDSTLLSSEQGDFSSVPVIDLAGMFSPDLEDRKAVASQVRAASHTVGFFYAKNHGIDDSYIQRTREQAERFFALDEEEKMKVFNKVPNQLVGYRPMLYSNKEQRKLRELRECFNFQAQFSQEHSMPGGERENLWPEGLPGFQETLELYQAQVLVFSRKLMQIFALALDLPENYYDSIITEPKASCEVIHYPPQEPMADQVGIGSHTDFEAFTVLKQDRVGGLQVLNKKGEFIFAPPIEGTYVVNIADLLQRQSNGYFSSTVHRVQNKSGLERYSIPYFFGFNPDAIIEVAPTCTSVDNPAKFEPTTAAEYIRWRVNKSKVN